MPAKSSSRPFRSGGPLLFGLCFGLYAFCWLRYLLPRFYLRA